MHPIILIVQARMSSERLPGKVMREVLGKPLLAYLVAQLRSVALADALVVATSTGSDEAPIIALCRQMGVACFQGDLKDVLGRYAAAAAAHSAETVVRICADCPLIDPVVVDRVISTYLSQAPEVDYISNCQQRTYPRGQDVEVFSRNVLEIAAREAKEPEEREHVTPYLYRHPERFRLSDVVTSPNHSSDRWVVDTAEDFQFIAKLLTALGDSSQPYHMEEVLVLLEKHPEWRKINAHIKQKGLYAH